MSILINNEVLILMVRVMLVVTKIREIEGFTDRKFAIFSSNEPVTPKIKLSKFALNEKVLHCQTHNLRK